MERGELTLGQQPEEQTAEESLRPQNLDEMIGQPRLREPEDMRRAEGCFFLCHAGGPQRVMKTARGAGSTGH